VLTVGQQEFSPLTLDKLLPPRRRNLLGSVTCPGVPSSSLPVVADDSDLTWAQLSDKLLRERAEHERLHYVLSQCKHCIIDRSHLVHFYITVIRPVTEYCAS